MMSARRHAAHHEDVLLRRITVDRDAAVHHADDSVLYFLHSDHLGSTSLTTDASGNPVARQLYDAWGNVRYVTGTLPTDIGYTGQRFDSYIKLVQMGARWYDPEIGRWLSPDTIVPDPVSPQQFNRFSFVTNNPLKYIDPTGHCGEGSTPGEGVSQEHHDLLCKLHDEALRLSGLVKQGGLTDLEALVQLLNFAAPLYEYSYTTIMGPNMRSDTTGFIRDLGIVVGGTDYTFDLGAILQGDNPAPRDSGGGLFRYIEKDNLNDPLSQYYIGIEAFGDTGFAPEFQDASNQVRHFLGGSLAGGFAYSGAARDDLISRETGASAQAESNVHRAGFKLLDALTVRSPGLPTPRITLHQTGQWVVSNLASMKLKRQYGILNHGR
jgi:RHS repeat-associated protein